jgi:hypothetical protein
VFFYVFIFWGVVWGGQVCFIQDALPIRHKSRRVLVEFLLYHSKYHATHSPARYGDGHSAIATVVVQDPKDPSATSPKKGQKTVQSSRDVAQQDDDATFLKTAESAGIHSLKTIFQQPARLASSPSSSSSSAPSSESFVALYHRQYRLEALCEAASVDRTFSSC